MKATKIIRLKEKSVTELDQEDRIFKMTESGGHRRLQEDSGIA